MNLAADQNTVATGLLTAGNEVREDPITFDADTPNGSQIGNYPWRSKDLQVLQSHLQYCVDLIDFVNVAISDGPELNMTMPKPPKPTLKSLFVKTKPKNF